MSLAINVTGAMFSDVMLSTYAFGQELRYPIRYALSLLAERGPRAPLLDAYQVDPETQAVLVVTLLIATIVVAAARGSSESRP
jgi:hypothetical protein